MDINSKIASLYQSGMSIPQIASILAKEQNKKISCGFVSGRLSQLNVKLRTISEASRTLDYNISFLNNEETISWIDGFVLGDGALSANTKTKVGRASCGVLFEEFCDHMVSGLKCYDPSIPKYSPPSAKTKEKNPNANGTFNSRTKFHPDLYHQWMRWYNNSTTLKQIPTDVRINKMSVLLWYLGDGCVIVDDSSNTITLRLSTDSFDKDCIENILIPKMKTIGIDCYRNNDNRVNISAAGIPAFFDLIGRESPIKCYSYKFDLPLWRFDTKRVSVVAKELGVKYDRLIYFVRRGLIPCIRLSKNGRPRLSPEHIEIAKQFIKNGEL